jgi:hypothetical protein|tara:strand:- start:566 stop:1117 length:552 start_codon:yes stop_codon:yes gene_type:complete
MNEILVEITFDTLPNLEGELKRATQIAFQQVTGELTARFDAAVSGNHWPWPDSTPRWGSSGGKTLEESAENWNTWQYGTGFGKKPKAVAGSPRSIVDSGDLKQSRDFQLNISTFTAEWNWGVDYAAAVHNGAYIHPFGNKQKLVQMPARPWTTAVLTGKTVAQGIPVYNPATEMTRLIPLLLK